MSQARFDSIVARAFNRYQKVSAAKALVAAGERRNIADASDKEVDALIKAAENAANSRVESTFIRRRS